MARSILAIVFSILLIAEASDAQSRNRHRSLASKPSQAVAFVTNPQSYSNLKNQAEETASAFLHKDFKTVVDLTYRRTVILMGGREKMASTMSRDVEQAESHGITFVSVAVGEPQDFQSVGRNLYAVVPTRVKLKVAEGVLLGEAFLIGVSEDGGNEWKFVDGVGTLDRGKLRSILPAAADKLRLPDKKQPVFFPNS
jgi:hypothetical protein